MGINNVSQNTPIIPKTNVPATPQASTNRGTQPLSSPFVTTTLDPGILEARKRLDSYKAALAGGETAKAERTLATIRANLDSVRGQNPEWTDQQWIDYLSTPPQIAVERHAEKAAETVVKAATPEQKADAATTSEKSGTYTAEEILIYKDLKAKLSPEGQANLKKLLKEGLLLKQDAKSSGNLLHYLNGLGQVNFDGLKLAEGARKESVVQQVLHDLAHPEDIRQRLDVSCLGTAGQYDMAANRPTEYARVVSELYSKTEVTDTSEGTAGGISQEALIKRYAEDIGGEFSFLNLGMLGKNITEGFKNNSYSKGYVENVVDYIEKRFPNMTEIANKYLGNLREAGIAFFKGDVLGGIMGIQRAKADDADHKARDEFGTMANSLVTDVGLTFQMNAATAGDKMGRYAKAGVFGNQGFYVDDQGKAAEALKNATAGGEEIYAVMKSGEDAGHMVVINGVKDGKITFYDPQSEGGKNDQQAVDASALSSQFLAVFLPAGSEGGLAHITEDDPTSIWGRGASGGTRR